MNDIESRIIQCFANVFPELGREELPGASMESVKRWDSVAHVTLLSAIGEEFSLDIAPEDFEDLTSFARIHEYVENQVSRSAEP